MAADGPCVATELEAETPVDDPMGAAAEAAGAAAATAGFDA
jgi:hypothetical protein